MIADLLEQIEDPEVQEAMRMLSERGLGVTVLHQHDDTSDVMTTLQDDVVQFEDDLRVTFVAVNDPILAGSVAVTAMWKDGPVVVGRCRQQHGGPVPPPPPTN
jgi:hypothetical protein